MNMVKSILDQATEHLRSVMEKLEKTVVFSDGCAAQYKSKLPFFHLSNACDKVAMERCYFGSGHVKRAVSFRVFGDETHYVEIRCRIVSELVQNIKLYVQGMGMAEHEEGGQSVVYGSSCRRRRS